MADEGLLLRREEPVSAGGASESNINATAPTDSTTTTNFGNTDSTFRKESGNGGGYAASSLSDTTPYASTLSVNSDGSSSGFSMSSITEVTETVSMGIDSFDSQAERFGTGMDQGANQTTTTVGSAPVVEFMTSGPVVVGSTQAAEVSQKLKNEEEFAGTNLNAGSNAPRSAPEQLRTVLETTLVEPESTVSSDPPAPQAVAVTEIQQDHTTGSTVSNQTPEAQSQPKPEEVPKSEVETTTSTVREYTEEERRSWWDLDLPEVSTGIAIDASKTQVPGEEAADSDEPPPVQGNETKIETCSTNEVSIGAESNTNTSTLAETASQHQPDQSSTISMASNLVSETKFEPELQNQSDTTNSQPTVQTSFASEEKSTTEASSNTFVTLTAETNNISSSTQNSEQIGQSTDIPVSVFQNTDVVSSTTTSTEVKPSETATATSEVLSESAAVQENNGSAVAAVTSSATPESTVSQVQTNIDSTETIPIPVTFSSETSTQPHQGSLDQSKPSESSFISTFESTTTTNTSVPVVEFVTSTPVLAGTTNLEIGTISAKETSESATFGGVEQETATMAFMATTNGSAESIANNAVVESATVATENSSSSVNGGGETVPLPFATSTTTIEPSQPKTSETSECTLASTQEVTTLSTTISSPEAVGTFSSGTESAEAVKDAASSFTDVATAISEIFHPTSATTTPTSLAPTVEFITTTPAVIGSATSESGLTESSPQADGSVISTDAGAITEVTTNALSGVVENSVAAVSLSASEGEKESGAASISQTTRQSTDDVVWIKEDGGQSVGAVVSKSATTVAESNASTTVAVDSCAAPVVFEESPNQEENTIGAAIPQSTLQPTDSSATAVVESSVSSTTAVESSALPVVSQESPKQEEKTDTTAVETSSAMTSSEPVNGSLGSSEEPKPIEPIVAQPEQPAADVNSSDVTGPAAVEASMTQVSAHTEDIRDSQNGFESNTSAASFTDAFVTTSVAVPENDTTKELVNSSSTMVPLENKGNVIRDDNSKEVVNSSSTAVPSESTTIVTAEAESATAALESLTSAAEMLLAKFASGENLSAKDINEAETSGGDHKFTWKNEDTVITPVLITSELSTASSTIEENTADIIVEATVPEEPKLNDDTVISVGNVVTNEIPSTETESLTPNGIAAEENLEAKTVPAEPLAEVTEPVTSVEVTDSVQNAQNEISTSIGADQAVSAETAVVKEVPLTPTSIVETTASGENVVAGDATNATTTIETSAASNGTPVEPSTMPTSTAEPSSQPTESVTAPTVSTEEQTPDAVIENLAEKSVTEETSAVSCETSAVNGTLSQEATLQPTSEPAVLASNEQFTTVLTQTPSEANEVKKQESDASTEVATVSDAQSLLKENAIDSKPVESSSVESTTSPAQKPLSEAILPISTVPETESSLTQTQALLPNTDSASNEDAKIVSNDQFTTVVTLRPSEAMDSQQGETTKPTTDLAPSSAPESAEEQKPDTSTGLPSEPSTPTPDPIGSTRESRTSVDTVIFVQDPPKPTSESDNFGSTKSPEMVNGGFGFEPKGSVTILPEFSVVSDHQPTMAKVDGLANGHVNTDSGEFVSKTQYEANDASAKVQEAVSTPEAEGPSVSEGKEEQPTTMSTTEPAAPVLPPEPAEKEPTPAPITTSRTTRDSMDEIDWIKVDAPVESFEFVEPVKPADQPQLQENGIAEKKPETETSSEPDPAPAPISASSRTTRESGDSIVWIKEEVPTAAKDEITKPTAAEELKSTTTTTDNQASPATSAEVSSVGLSSQVITDSSPPLLASQETTATGGSSVSANSEKITVAESELQREQSQQPSPFAANETPIDSISSNNNSRPPTSEPQPGGATSGQETAGSSSFPKPEEAPEPPKEPKSVSFQEGTKMAVEEGAMPIQTSVPNQVEPAKEPRVVVTSPPPPNEDDIVWIKEDNSIGAGSQPEKENIRPDSPSIMDTTSSVFDISECERNLNKATEDTKELVGQLCDKSNELKQNNEKIAEEVAAQRKFLATQPDVMKTIEDNEQLPPPPELPTGGLPRNVESVLVGEGHLKHITGSIVLPTGNVLVTDEEHGILVFALDGTVVKKINSQEWRRPRSPLYHKEHVLMVVDLKQDGEWLRTIMKFSMHLDFIARIEGPQWVKDKTVLSERISIALNDNLYMTVCGEIFSAVYELTPVGMWTELEYRQSESYIDMLAFAVIGPITQLLVVEGRKNYVLQLSIRESQLVARRRIAICERPGALARDEAGRLFVANRSSASIQLVNTINWTSQRNVAVADWVVPHFSASWGLLALPLKDAVRLQKYKFR